MWVFVSALERKLNEAETEKFNIKQMKDLFEQKAAQLATETVGLCGSGERGGLRAHCLTTMMHCCTTVLNFKLLFLIMK